MARQRGFIDVDVLTEAKKRIHHLYDLFDTIVVSFSGGKDSLAALHLVREVALERGDERPIKTLFYDEELIPDPVIDFVEQYRHLDWIDLTWLTVPLQSNKYILGKSVAYTQWDPAREWIRPKPAHGLSADHFGIPPERSLSQYDMNELVGTVYRGRVAMVTGIRAAESLMRFRASVNKLNENYINATTTTKVSLCKPLFDWAENDIFRYFYDQGIAYCPIYDAQILAGGAGGGQLRVSTPLHAEAAKNFGQLREVAPTFYGQLIEMFPEMLVQERYYREFDQASLLREWLTDDETDLSGVDRWIRASIDDPKQRALALKRLRAVRVRARSRPASYPATHILKQFITGAFKREILPLAKD